MTARRLALLLCAAAAACTSLPATNAAERTDRPAEPLGQVEVVIQERIQVSD
jgi:hypothetical protein